mmetsp:Transcript_70988/g.148500  ORF Transcript_70988/g.148500 Transcript_70988/m.148500 type:complete len:612 (-) Transcript_70988:534-2369(-)
MDPVSIVFPASDVGNTEDIVRSPVKRRTRTLRTVLEDFLTFKDGAGLLRATTLAVVLSRGSIIFNTPAGNRATYNLSDVTDSIDVFLSHNWNTPRFDKFCTLVYEYNFDMAVMIMIVAAMALTIFSCFSAALQVPDMTIDETLDSPPLIAFGSKFLTVPLFFFVLFFGRDIANYFRRMPGPSLFLDKCCIEQVDSEAKNRGIRKLGAFLTQSREMLVLYSDTYLQRLWTIYEMASFLAIHDLNHLKIIPVSQPKTFFVVTGAWWIYHLLITIIRWFESFYFFMYLLLAIGGYAVMLYIRHWARDKAATHERMTKFMVEDSICANEADRPLVYFNIQCLMQGTGLVDIGSSVEVALAAFNNLVRTTLPHALLTMEGSRVFRSRDYLVLAIVTDGVEALDWFATLWCQGVPLRIIIPETLYHIIWAACWPASLAVWVIISSNRISIRGWLEKAMVGAWVLIFALFLGAFDEIVTFVTVDARESDTSLAILVGITIGTWIAGLVLCWGRRPTAAPRLDEIRRSVTESLSSEDICETSLADIPFEDDNEDDKGADEDEQDQNDDNPTYSNHHDLEPAATAIAADDECQHCTLAGVSFIPAEAISEDDVERNIMSL